MAKTSKSWVEIGKENFFAMIPFDIFTFLPFKSPPLVVPRWTVLLATYCTWSLRGGGVAWPSQV